MHKRSRAKFNVTKRWESIGEFVGLSFCRLLFTGRKLNSFSHGPYFMNDRPIRFPDWKNVLARSALSQSIQACYTREILLFLRLCKTTRSPATIELIKQHLAVREARSPVSAREALRWFFRESQKALKRGEANATLPPEPATDTGSVPAPGNVIVGKSPSESRPMEPPPAATDLGSTDWERALIKTMRERGLLWRSESVPGEK